MKEVQVETSRDRSKQLAQPARRKIVQITSAYNAGDGLLETSSSYPPHVVLHALCTDGSLWVIGDAEQDIWVRLPDVPQN